MSEASAYRLRRLKLKRVSLVDKPANAHAEVVLFKRDDGAEKGDLGSGARDDLEDSKFAAVWTDADGKKQRKLPIHDAAHVRNALARFNQTDMPAEVKSRARQKLEAAARKFGIGQDDKKQKSASYETRQEALRNGLKRLLGDPWAPGAVSWQIEATFDDHVVVNQSGERWSYPFTWDEDEDDVVFGERTDVEVDYKPVREKSVKKDADGDNDVTKGECPECGAKVGKGDKFCPKCGEKLPAGAAMKSTSIDLDKIEDKDTREAVKKALEDLEAATALAEEEQGKRIAAEKKATAAPAKPSDEDVLKGLSPEARAVVLKAQEDAKAAKAEAKVALDAVKKAAEEKREGEFIAKAKGYGNLPLKAETFGPVLKRLADGVATKEDLDELSRVLKAANEIAKGLFTQKGSSGRGASGGSGAWAEIEAKAKELRETVLKAGDKLSYEQAVDRVIREDQALYKRYLDESRPVAVEPAAGEE